MPEPLNADERSIIIDRAVTRAIKQFVDENMTAIRERAKKLIPEVAAEFLAKEPTDGAKLP